MLILGADPGATGALALLDTADVTRLVALWPMPTVLVQRSQAKKPVSAVDPRGLLRLFDGLFDLYCIDAFAVEKVGGIPKQSAPSAFNFGSGYGALLTAAISQGWVVHEVPPATWKSKMRCPKDKAAATAFGATTFPGSAEAISQAGKRDKGGSAEAALLALYVARHVLCCGT